MNCFYGMRLVVLSYLLFIMRLLKLGKRKTRFKQSCLYLILFESK